MCMWYILTHPWWIRGIENRIQGLILAKKKKFFFGWRNLKASHKQQIVYTMAIVNRDKILLLSVIFSLLQIGLVLCKGFDVNGEKESNKCK